MYMDKDRLRQLYILPEEIKKISSEHEAYHNIDRDIRQSMECGFGVEYKIYNFMDQPIRVVGSDGIEVKINPSRRPPNYQQGILILTIFANKENYSKIDPNYRLNVPETRFQEAFQHDRDHPNKEVFTTRRLSNKEPHVKVSSTIKATEFDNVDHVYDSITDFVITLDVEKKVMHPRSEKFNQYNEVIDLAKESDRHGAYVKYVLVDNSGRYQHLFINNGHHILRVDSIEDITRSSGLYTYAYGLCKESKNKSTKIECVRYDVKSILDDGLWAYHSYQEAARVGDHMSRLEAKVEYENKIRDAHRDYIESEKSERERDMKEKEMRNKTIIEGFKVLGSTIGLLGSAFAVYKKLNAS